LAPRKKGSEEFTKTQEVATLKKNWGFGTFFQSFADSKKGLGVLGFLESSKL